MQRTVRQLVELALLLLGGVALARDSAKPVLNGCFYSYAARLDWDEAQWRAELNWLKSMGLTTLVLTTAAHGNEAYYPSGLPWLTVKNETSLEMTLSLTDELGFQVHLMPYDSTSYWNRSDATFFDQLAEQTVQVTDDIYKQYHQHRSLVGFYYSPEFWYPASTMLQDVWIHHYLGPLADHVKKLNKHYRVSFAPFVGITEQYDSEDFREFWNKMLAGAPNLDLVMIQDGIGAFEHVWRETNETEITLLKKSGRSYAYLERIYRDMQQVCQEQQRTFWSDLEAFETVGFGYPPHISRIVNQLKVAAPYTEKIVAFEGLYLSPTAGVSSIEFGENYRRYLADRPFIENVARGMRYEISAPLITTNAVDEGRLTDGGQDGGELKHFMGWHDDAPAQVTIDLGLNFSEITGFAASFREVGNLKILHPESVEVWTGAERATLRRVGALSAIRELHRGDVTAIETLFLEQGVQGRFVQFRFPQREGIGTLCSELAVYSQAPEWLSRGKSYRVSLAPSREFPDEWNELTDGNMARRWYAEVGWNRPPQPVAVTIDLQQEATISSVKAACMESAPESIQLPQVVRVSFSSDGTTFTQPVALACDKAPVNKFTPQFSAMVDGKGRYVKFELQASENSWVMCNELQVFGHKP